MVANQWIGKYPVADRLAKPMIDRELYPSMHQNDAWQEGIRFAIASELTEKNCRHQKSLKIKVTAQVSTESVEVIPTQFAK